MDQLAHQPFWFWTKGEFKAACCSEKVGNDRVAASLHSFEQKRRAATFNHAAMNLRSLEVRINFRFDVQNFVFSIQEIEKCAQVRMHLGRRSIAATRVR